MVIELRDGDSPVLGIVVEVLVITADESVARWAARRIEIGVCGECRARRRAVETVL